MTEPDYFMSNRQRGVRTRRYHARWDAAVPAWQWAVLAACIAFIMVVCLS